MKARRPTNREYSNGSCTLSASAQYITVHCASSANVVCLGSSTSVRDANRMNKLIHKTGNGIGTFESLRIFASLLLCGTMSAFRHTDCWAVHTHPIPAGEIPYISADSWYCSHCLTMSFLRGSNNQPQITIQIVTVNSSWLLEPWCWIILLEAFLGAIVWLQLLSSSSPCGCKMAQPKFWFPPFALCLMVNWLTSLNG